MLMKHTLGPEMLLCKQKPLRHEMYHCQAQFPHLLIPSHIHWIKVLDYQYKELLRQETMSTQINQQLVSWHLHRHRLLHYQQVVLKPIIFRLIWDLFALQVSVALAPQYPLLQSSTQQPTVTCVYSGHLSSVLPQQSVSYAMPAQSNGTQANDLMGFDPISSASFSISSPQQYWLPQPFVQQSVGGQVYPGQLMNVSSYQPGSHGMPAQSSGASSADTPGIHLKKLSLPTSGQRKDWPGFKTAWKQKVQSKTKQP